MEEEKYTMEAYLSNRTQITSYRLKNKLLQTGLKEYKCESCDLDQWKGNPIPLELHHIDGNSANNNITNLQTLCPNCHSMTSNYRGSKKKLLKSSYDDMKDAIESSLSIREAILKLGYSIQGSHYSTIRKFISKYSIKLREKNENDLLLEKQRKEEVANNRRKNISCFPNKREVAWENSRRANRPTKEELLTMVWNKSVSKIAKDYGLSDNAIRKWAKQYDIPVPPVGWWAKWNNDYFEECLLIKNNLFTKYKLVGVKGLEPSKRNAD